jgi:hypothetical protein
MKLEMMMERTIAPEAECVPTTSPTTTTEGRPSTSWTTTVRQEDQAR